MTITPAAIAGYPVLDVDALTALSETMGASSTAGNRFVRSYLDRWPERITALAEAVAHTDVAGSLSAAETIRSSATQIGAARVQCVAERLSHALRDGDLSEARGLLGELRRFGGEAIAALEVTVSNRAHADTATDAATTAED